MGPRLFREIGWLVKYYSCRVPTTWVWGTFHVEFESSAWEVKYYSIWPDSCPAHFQVLFSSWDFVFFPMVLSKISSLFWTPGCASSLDTNSRASPQTLRRASMRVHHIYIIIPLISDLRWLTSVHLFSANTLKYRKALSKPLYTHPDYLAMTIDAHFCIKKKPSQVIKRPFYLVFNFIHPVKIHRHSFQNSGKPEVPLVPSRGAWLGFLRPFGCLDESINDRTGCQVTQAAGHGLPGAVAEHQESGGTW